MVAPACVVFEKIVGPAGHGRIHDGKTTFCVPPTRKEVSDG